MTARDDRRVAASLARVPARYYGHLAAILAWEGIDFEAIARRLHLPPKLFFEPDAMLPLATVERLVQQVVQASRRTDLGFEFGRNLSASAHSLVGFGMLSCATLDEALRFEAQYYRLVLPCFRMRYSGSPAAGEMQVDPLTAMSHGCLAFHLEAIATAALREVADLSGHDHLPCQLDLSIPEPPHARRYRELTNVRVRFGMGGTPLVRLRFLVDPRAIPVKMADASARRAAEAACQREARRLAHGRRVGEWVSMVLRESSGPLPALTEVARILNLSARTLNRHLEREGTTFRDLAGRAQHDLACQRLQEVGRRVCDVGYSLGFSDPSNFARAFRARAGQTPGQYRVGVRRKSAAARPR